MTESQARRVFHLVALAQALWWPIWAALGRTEQPGFLVVSTLVLWAILANLPQERIQNFHRVLMERPITVWSLLTVTASALVLWFFRSSRTFSDSPALLRASANFSEHGFLEYLSRYFSLEFMGSLHPPLVPILISPWIALVGTESQFVPLIFVVFGLCCLGLTYLLGSELFGKRAALLACLALLGTRYFWLYICTPGLVAPVVAGGLLLHLGASRLAREQRMGLWLAALGFLLALYSKYIAIFLIPGFLVWAGQGVSKRALSKVALLVAALYLPWLVYTAVDGRQFDPISRHVAVTPVFTKSGNLARDSEGQIRYSYEHIKNPSWIKKRVVGTVGFFASQGMGVLILLCSLLWFQGFTKVSPVLLAWIAGCFLAILILPTSRYFIPGLPAVSLLLGKALTRCPEHWAIRILGFLVGAALLAFFQHPASPYIDLTPITQA